MDGHDGATRDELTLSKEKDYRPGEDHIRRTRETHQILYPALREVARRHGYALALHGSLERDIDYLAVPWTEKAASPFELVRDVVLVVENVLGWTMWGSRTTLFTPEQKPHGRLAWSIILGATYIDLSVMPPTPTPKEPT